MGPTLSLAPIKSVEKEVSPVATKTTNLLKTRKSCKPAVLSIDQVLDIDC
jgi:hypothetical protein